MSLPNDLIDSRDSALRALSSDANGVLELQYRKRIWAAFGPRDSKVSNPALLAPHRRRAILAICTARHVLPIWVRAWADDDRAHKILSVAEGYLDQTVDIRSARTQLGRFKTDLDNLLGVGEQFDAAYAGFAAARALSTALYDEIFEAGENVLASDADLDPYEWDASFYASLASAGGAPWEENSDPTSRRQFWEWYLKEAVDLAWASVKGE